MNVHNSLIYQYKRYAKLRNKMLNMSPSLHTIGDIRVARMDAMDEYYRLRNMLELQNMSIMNVKIAAEAI